MTMTHVLFTKTPYSGCLFRLDLIFFVAKIHCCWGAPNRKFPQEDYLLTKSDMFDYDNFYNPMAIYNQCLFISVTCLGSCCTEQRTRSFLVDIQGQNGCPFSKSLV